jgi:starch synthase
VNILMVASECVPLIKTGGLADVVGALPRALEAQGCRVRVLLPNYPMVASQLGDARPIVSFDDLFGGPASIKAADVKGVKVLALDAPHLFDRPGNPYLGPDGRDWPDNQRRFAALSRAAARVVSDVPDGWLVDVVHCHDWQAGLTPVYLARELDAAPPVVFTIHNIAFQGLFPSSEVQALGLPWEAFTPDGYEFYGQLSFLKAGLVFSDRLTTVSPTYAAELQTKPFGMGLDGVIRARHHELVGILNGIDDHLWNPETDPQIAAPYSLWSLDNKKINRAALQKAMELDLDPAAFLACVVSRLTDQKGLDLLIDVLPALVETGGQLALLGTGTPAIEEAFRAAATRYQGRVGVRIAYDEPLSRLLIAGADAILVPSRFEPCGLTQMYGLRYGTIPIVARTGGLADSVIDANVAAVEAGVATGIVFDPNDADGLDRALSRAIELFQAPGSWRELMRSAMRQPVGWSSSAAHYERLYRSVLTSSQAARGGGQTHRPGTGATRN